MTYSAVWGGGLILRLTRKAFYYTAAAYEKKNSSHLVQGRNLSFQRRFRPSADQGRGDSSRNRVAGSNRGSGPYLTIRPGERRREKDLPARREGGYGVSTGTRPDASREKGPPAQLTSGGGGGRKNGSSGRRKNVSERGDPLLPGARETGRGDGHPPKG